MSMFTKAVRHQLKGKIAIDGPSGSGKTFTALRLATALADGGKIAVINTESGAIQKYLGLSPDGTTWEFDVCELTNFAPTAYTEAILEAGKSGYSVLLIDSLSHAWEGEGGALEQVTKASDRSKNSFTAWKDVTPQHNRMIQAILKSPCHVVATMRSKTEYVLEVNEKGKSVPLKVGMAPVQRAGMEYEFDLYLSMDWDHVMRASKSRCPDLDGVLAVKPSVNTFLPFAQWLNEGTPVPDGYYSASESDFKKFEQGLVAEVNSKPLSAIEKAKELSAAKAETQKIVEASESGGQSLKGRHSVSTSDPCTDQQVEQIKSAISQAVQTGNPDLASRIKKKLRGCGVEKLAELTIDEARQLLAAIEAKEIEAFFDSVVVRSELPS
jgi:uncharacterized protein YjhX (UPF0386 family)